MDPLQIKSIEFFEAVSSKSQPIADATHSIPEIKFIICEILLENGIKGQGYLLAFHFNPNAIKGALKDIKSFIESGYRIDETSRLTEDHAKECEYFGTEGLLRWPLAMLNIAMWDALGNYKKEPIWRLLGGEVKKIPVYGSGGWLSYSIDELIDEVLDYKKRGFQAVKVKVGHQEIEQDIERISRVRESIGPDMKLMIDANQGMQVFSAIRLIESTREYQINWFEEPLDHKDFDGYQRIKQQTGVNLAMGEREYDTLALEILAANDALDIWQPDIIRIGGVEQWQRSALQAQQFNLKVAPHYYKDYDIPLLCTIENDIGAESFDWIDDLIDNPMKIVDGSAIPRDSAGWGFSFKEEKMTKLEL
jgi:L-alanine-DL-glutamate epimerase-like enolase superfamily enzyme